MQSKSAKTSLHAQNGGEKPLVGYPLKQCAILLWYVSRSDTISLSLGRVLQKILTELESTRVFQLVRQNTYSWRMSSFQNRQVLGKVN